MSQTRWAVDGPDGTSLELKGRKYSSNDDGAPMMCNLVCLAMGRHVHVDYCRAQDGTPCDAAEVQHIPTGMVPDPARLKDFVTHKLYWKRTGTSFRVLRTCPAKFIIYPQDSRVCFNLYALSAFTSQLSLRRSVSPGRPSKLCEMVKFLIDYLCSFLFNITWQ